jgi:hypothetical protein
LGLGRRVEVVAPAKLKDRVQVEIAAMAERLEISGKPGRGPQM